jgi:Raf kinase inhibitor-like YbhB/YbcL family protein
MGNKLFTDRTFYTDNLINGETPMNLTSSAFSPDAPIPTHYTCDAADISPPLSWSGLPAGTQSLALIVDDPDAPDPAAPKMTWVHWVLYNLPPDTQGLAEAVPTDSLPEGTREGLNDWKRTGYGGEQAIQGHVLEKSELVGSYQKR